MNTKLLKTTNPNPVKTNPPESDGFCVKDFCAPTPPVFSDKKSRPLILGIDPGFHGALAFFRQDNFALRIFDMPIFTRLKRTEIDTASLQKILKSHAAQIKFAAIEEVSAAPGQGVSSTFRFGFGYGLLIGCISILEIPIVRIKPSIWKNAFQLSSDKNLSRKKASELWPNYSKVFARVKDDGRAEAALISLFASRRIKLKD